MININTHKIPIYGDYLNILIGEKEEVINYLKYDLNLSDSISFSYTKSCCIFVSGNIYIWFEKDLKNSIRVHEICHAVYEIMIFHGLQLSDQEAFCYLAEYITEHVDNLITKINE